MYATITGFYNIKILLDIEDKFQISKFSLKEDNVVIGIDEFNIEGNLIDIKTRIPINIKKQYFVCYDNICLKATMSKLFNSLHFNEKYYFDGELGAIYKNTNTVFRLWAPAALWVNLLIYKNGDSDIPEHPIKIDMKEGNNGVFSVDVKGDLKGNFYTYSLSVYGNVEEVTDPYAKACGVNGNRGAIIDFSDTNIEGWSEDKGITINNYTDAIIYETSIRDISMNPSSGIQFKGKFLGLTESSTKTSKKVTTGFSHIKDLGVTHVQFLPIFDFKTVDEKNPVNYNWGYDPQNYNIPEGSYSTNPYDPYCRIIELKRMIKHFHDNNLGVNMDVVYNHIWHYLYNNLEKIFPGYYLRRQKDGKFSNGSGCGNDIASENSMVRKFILDSVLFWAKEYHIDGFRFDLMGLIDIDTMNLIKGRLNDLKRNIMIYGEGWNIDTELIDNLRSKKANACYTPFIAYFNDDVRNSIRGGVFDLSEKGFVSGKPNLENQIKSCVCGNIDYDNNIKGDFLSPEQTINYVDCHDNSTLWDKLINCNVDSSIEDLKKMVKLSFAIIFTSQGVPFLQCGSEFGRTKNGITNSYNSPDRINSIDWDRKIEFFDIYSYCKGLINLRKNHPAFKMDSSDKVKNSIKFIESPKNTVAFTINGKINGDSFENILVIYNSNKEKISLKVDKKVWFLICNEEYVSNIPFSALETDTIEVSPISASILYSNY